MASTQAPLIGASTNVTKATLERQNIGVGIEPVRIGVVGCGFFGGLHAQKYMDQENAVLAGVYDAARERGARIAQSHKSRAFDTLDEMLSSVDAVSITTPASSHYEVARTCLERGLHVLVEKPIALDLDHADALIHLADENNLVLQVGHQERYVFREFGILGRKKSPRRLMARRLGPFMGRATDVSVIFDLMIHDLDLLHQINPSSVAHVEARAQQTHTDHPDEVCARLTMEDGCVVELSASRIHEEKLRDMHIEYDDGVIEVDFVNRELKNTTREKLVSPFTDESGQNIIMKDPLGYGIGLFVESVRNGDEPHVTGQCGRRALATALQITESLTYD